MAKSGVPCATLALGTDATWRRFPPDLIVRCHQWGFSMRTKLFVMGLRFAALLAMNAGGSYAGSSDSPGVKKLPAPDAKSVGSGIPSQPPGNGIGGNNPGSMGSTGGQGTSGGNMKEGGNGGSNAGPTGSGSPGTGANQPRGQSGQ